MVKKINLLVGVAREGQILMGVSPRGLATWLKIASCECSPICGFFPSMWEGFWLYLITGGRAEALKGGAVWECLGCPAVLGLLLELWAQTSRANPNSL